MSLTVEVVEDGMPVPKRKVSRKPSAKPDPRIRLVEVTLRKFKASNNSGPIRLDRFNVIIGRNGAGKSTLIEALQWIDHTLREGARSACERYHGIHDIINVREKGGPKGFILGVTWTQNELKEPAAFRYVVGVRESKMRTPSIEGESLDIISASGQPRRLIDTHFEKEVPVFRWIQTTPSAALAFDNPDQLALSYGSRIAYTERKVRRHSEFAPIDDFWNRAVFLRLSPSRLAQTTAPQRRPTDPLLDEEGQQLPALLNELSDTQRVSMMKRLEAVLADFKEIAVSQPISAREEEVFFSLIEEMPSGKTARSARMRIQIPSWMLSEGTRRLTALFALLHHDPPPSLLCIEEIENGLDPWTLITVLKELQSAAARGVQIIITTHSPWLLDHVDLGSILYVRRENGETRYERFADRADVKAYQGTVPPGAIYVHEEP